MTIWRAGQDKTSTGLCSVVDGNAYSEIKETINASEAWKLLEANFQPRGPGFSERYFFKSYFISLWAYWKKCRRLRFAQFLQRCEMN